MSWLWPVRGRMPGKGDLAQACDQRVTTSGTSPGRAMATFALQPPRARTSGRTIRLISGRLGEFP
jgi:hypothetical protein